MAMQSHEVNTHQQQALNQVGIPLHANLSRGSLESEERFRQVADALHDVIALTDVAFEELLFVNVAYDRVWGRSRDSLGGNPRALLDGVHPDDRARVSDALRGRASEAFDLEFRVVRPSGDERWLWYRGFPVRNAEGEIHRMASIIEDITERRQIIESHQRLIRGFTHDVKNPLGAADGHLALLEEGIHGELSTMQTDALRRARNAIRTALKLVAQLLDIERAEAGQLVVHLRPVDVGTITHEIVDEFRAAATAKQLTLSLSIPRDSGALIVESDAERLRQILANLISNATKYTQHGGHVTIRGLAEGELDGPWHGRWIAIVVEDNGPGIPFEKQNLLFREFTRFQPDEAEGSGIGLAISQRLARALGASITFKSTPGGGSTFTLWLPSDGTAPSLPA